MTETDSNIYLLQTIADLQKRQESLEKALREKEQLIANHKRAEERTVHLKKVLRAIRNVNQLIVKETDPGKLIERATQTLTETLGYYSAWIALVSNNDKTLNTSAHTGFAEGFKPMCTQMAQGKFPDCMKKALESGVTIVVENPTGDCSNCPIRPEFDGRAALTKSLAFDGKIYGILTVSVPGAYAHDPEEQSLFNEVAEDLGFALHKIETAKALQEGKELYHVLFECTQNPILVANQDGIYIDANDAALQFLETERESLLGKTVWHYTPQDLIADQKREHAPFLEPRTLETVYEVNGKRKTLLLNVVPANKGNQTILFGIGQDITERIRAEELLRESELLYRSTLKASPDGIVIADLEGKISIVSPSVLTMFGYSEEMDLQGQLATVFLAPDEHRRAKSSLGLMCQGEKNSGPMEYRGQHADNTLFDIEVNCDFIHDTNGQPTGMVFIIRDITKRKQAEASLRDTTMKLETTIKVGRIGLWNFDLNTKKFVYSPECLSQIGYDENEIFDGPAAWRTMVHPDDLAKSMSVIQDALISNKTSFTTELRMRHKDGSYRWLFSQCSVDRDQSGQPIRVLGSQMDITERKRADEAIQESERNYREIFNASGEAIFLIDNATFRMLDTNNAALNMFGYETKNEIMACEVWDLMVTDEPPYTQEEAMRLRETVNMQGPQLFVWLGVKKSGERFWVEVSVRGTQIGGEGRILTVIRDITERKHAEAERERLIAAIEQAGEVIMITDPEGTIQYTNPAFERITGYKCNEVIGKNPRILKSGTHDIQYYNSVWNTIKEGNTWEGRFVNKRKDGGFYTEEASISPVRDASGAIVNFVAVQRDISRELETERQLLQAQKMESIGRLAGGVAHDFNNMLVAILGYAEMCRYELPSGHRIRRWIDEIINAGQRSSNLTRQLLAFARQQQISPMVLDINDVVSSMIKLLQRLIGEHIDLVWIPGANLGPVKFDPSQVDQILANLCVNARDAITGSGKVTIKTENATIEHVNCDCRTERDYLANVTVENSSCTHHAEVAPGTYVILSVSDNGCGMEGNILAHIFEPFFTTKAVGEGTGLGLSTVYGIVKQNNGYINVHSERGKGTTFKIYIPRFTGDVKKPADAEAEQPPLGAGETVLLIEDEQSVRSTCRLFLEDLGYKVLEAETPAKALEIAKQHINEIDLLLTDVIMPEMDGLQLTNRIRDLKPDLKVIFMSGYTASVIAQHGVLEEGVHLITKPFSRQDLGFKVREVLEEG